MRKQHEPRVKDPFWDENRQAEGLQPNGFIDSVFKNGGEIDHIRVTFYDTEGNKKYRTYYPGDLDGAYSEKYKGYRLYI